MPESRKEILKKLENQYFGLAKVKEIIEADSEHNHDEIELNDLLHDNLPNSNDFIAVLVQDLKEHLRNSDSIEKTQQNVLVFLQHQIAKLEMKISDILEGKM
jgi:DNA-binding transcriptional MerR regulator